MASSELRNLAAAQVATDILGTINVKMAELKALLTSFSQVSNVITTDVASATDLKGEIDALKDEIDQIVSANVPGHEWDGTSLRLMNPNGSWGSAVNLKGQHGIQGIQGIQGPEGPRGLKGDPGDKGDVGDRGAAFEPDAFGSLSQRYLYNARAEGFAFLDTDLGEIYYRVTSTAGVWSAPARFGKGDDGDVGLSAYQIAVRNGFVGTESQWLASVTPSAAVQTRFGNHGLGVPVSGTWARGTIVWNDQPGPNEPLGWVCVTAGTPGTWRPFAII